MLHAIGTSRQANSSVTTSVRRQDSNSLHNNRRVNKTLNSKTTFLQTIVRVKQAACSSVPTHPRPPFDASDKSEKTSVEEGERIETVDHSHINFTDQDIDLETQERLCDATDTEVQEEDIQQFWDAQSGGVKYYMSTINQSRSSSPLT